MKELDKVVLPSTIAGTIYIKKKEKTPEQLANELGYRIGDKCWTKDGKYEGIILNFTKYNWSLGAVFQYQIVEYIENLTNKVAIQCSNKEDMMFMYKLLGYQYINIGIEYKYNYVYVNDKMWASGYNEEHIKDHLILSIDDYCKAMDIKPLFVTDDKVNIYNPKQKLYFLADDDSCFILNYENIYNIHNYCKAYKCKVFSTQQTAQQYLDSITFPKYIVVTERGSNDTYNKEFKGLNPKYHDNNKINIEVLKVIKEVPDYKNINTSYVCEEGHVIYKQFTKEVTKEDYDKYLDSLNPILFYTEDFKDGSFPVKSCSNCTYNKNGNIDMTNCHQSCTNANPKWQGKLKGEPIRKGDKCWFVENGYEPRYDLFQGNSKEYGKYFSNETNARNYYNKLVEESKPKFEVGKWYKGKTPYFNNEYIALYLNVERNPGFTLIDNVWSDHITTFKTDFTKWQPADMNKVKELLYNEAKRRYPIYCKVKDLCWTGRIEQIMLYNYKGAIENSWNGIEIWFININNEGIKVYSNGKWAEIIEEPKLITENKVNIYLNDKFWVYNPQLNKIDELIMLDKFKVINRNKYFSTKEAAEKYKKNITDSILKDLYEAELKQLKLKYQQC